MTEREFRNRLAPAQEFEQRVVGALLERGWAAEPFGQGQLTPAMRDHIRRVDTAVRWMPDIIAAKRFAAQTLITFTDAKAGEKWRETGNHSIEAAALASAEKWIEMSGDRCPYYFVFADGGVATPSVIRELGRPGAFRGVGSGTPFLLLPVSACQKFDAIFGTPTAAPVKENAA